MNDYNSAANDKKCHLFKYQDKPQLAMDTLKTKQYNLLKSLYNYFDYKTTKAQTMEELTEYNNKAVDIMKVLYESEFGVEFKETRQLAKEDILDAEILN